VTDDTALVRCHGATRTYGSGATSLTALAPTDCHVPPGARIALVGRSGSGKSTLVHLMAGLDDPTEGVVDWPALGPRAALRPGPVGVVFQGPSLLPPLTVLENVALPLVLGGMTEVRARERAAEALASVELADLARKLPEEISGGQAQRAAVARALAGEARLLLADEPTGQLDHPNAAAVVDVLLEAAARNGAALVVATHDPEVARRLDTQWSMRDGRLTTEKDAAWSR
jgi:putative ABC transport system ATP-binding protein/lipoprotein-releasing system ATP-binding protein